MSFLENVDFWDTVLRLIKYLSVGATAYFAWYGAAHETRNERGDLTRAGKIVVRGVVVSLIFGLMSQFAEDKREVRQKRLESVEKDSTQKVLDAQRRIDDKNQREQIKRLETLLNGSDKTLQRLKHQDSIQNDIMNASKISLQSLNNQNKLQQQLINSSKETIENLKLQSSQQLILMTASNQTLTRLSKQDSMQKGLLTEISSVNNQIIESSTQQNKLIADQQQLLKQANSQVYPLSPISFYFKIRYAANEYELSHIGKVRKDSILHYQPFKGRRQVKADKFSRLYNKSDFWSIKIYKKLKAGSWEAKPGLVYLITDKNQYSQKLEVEVDSGNYFFDQSTFIKNPTKIMRKLDEKDYVNANNPLYNLFGYNYLSHGLSIYNFGDKMGREFMDNIGTPSIFSILDLIDSKIEIETVLKKPLVDVKDIKIEFGNNFNNHSVYLVNKSPQKSYEDILLEILSVSNKKKTPQYLPSKSNLNRIVSSKRVKTENVRIVKIVNKNSTWDAPTDRYRVTYTDIMTKDDLGIINQ